MSWNMGFNVLCSINIISIENYSSLTTEKVNQSCPKTRTGIVVKFMYNFDERF